MARMGKAAWRRRPAARGLPAVPWRRRRRRERLPPRVQRRPLGQQAGACTRRRGRRVRGEARCGEWRQRSWSWSLPCTTRL